MSNGIDFSRTAGRIRSRERKACRNKEGGATGTVVSVMKSAILIRARVCHFWVVVVLLCGAAPVHGVTNTFSVTLDKSTTKDSYIIQTKPNENHGKDNKLVVREDSEDDRSVIEFPVDSLVAGWTVISAELTFTIRTLNVYNGIMAMSAHRLLEPWDEGNGKKNKDVSWNKRKTGITWTSAGGTYRAVPAGRDTLVDGDTTATFDITSAVSFWAENPDSNFGLLIADATELVGTSDADKVEFNSSDEGAVSKHPALALTLTDTPADTSADSVYAEIQPFSVTAGTRPTLVLYVNRVLGTWGTGSTWFQLTMPSGFTSPSVSAVTFNGSPSTYSNWGFGSNLFLDINTPDIAGRLAITFDVDAPASADPVGKDFIPRVSN